MTESEKFCTCGCHTEDKHRCEECCDSLVQYERGLKEGLSCPGKEIEQAYQRGLAADKTVRELFQASVCYDEGYRAGVEDAAKVCEENDEVTNLRTSVKTVLPKTSNNVNGNGYARAIRALKPGGKP